MTAGTAAAQAQAVEVASGGVLVFDLLPLTVQG